MLFDPHLRITLRIKAALDAATEGRVKLEAHKLESETKLKRFTGRIEGHFRENVALNARLGCYLLSAVVDQEHLWRLAPNYGMPKTRVAGLEQ